MAISDRSVLPEHALLPPTADADFDRMAALARRVLDVPAATICLVTTEQSVLPGAAGVGAELNAVRSVPLEYSLCRFVVRDAAPLIVTDTLQSGELAQHPAVLELGLRAYAGMPVCDVDGVAVGALAVTDTAPRVWSDADLAVLADLAAACSSQLKLRQVSARAAVVSERDRIATALQSEVVTALFRHSMQLSNVRAYATDGFATQLTDAIEQVDAIIVRLRNSIYQLG